MSSIIPLAEINPSNLGPADYAVFGGTFNPIHEGHIQALHSLCRLFPLVVAAPTKINPWKQNQPEPAPLELRREMIRLALEAEGIAVTAELSGNGVYISGLDYVYTEELVNHLRRRRAGQIYWVVGADIADSVQHWKNWDNLEITAVVVPIVIDTHATLVRSGAAKAHPALVEFIRDHRLYQDSRTS